MITARPSLAAAPSRLAELEVVSTQSGFDALRPEWEALVERLTLPSPFHGWTWNRAWWEHFGRGRLQLLVIRRDGELRGIAQFHERPHAPLLTSLAPLGWGNRLTEQLDLLLPESDRPELLEAVTGWLAGQGHTWAWLPGLQEGELATTGAGIVYSQPAAFESLCLPDSWEAFVAGLNKSMRDNVKYYPKLMLRHGHDFELRVASTPAAVRESLPVLYRLHRLRAELRGGVAHKNYMKKPEDRAFLDEVLPDLAELDQAEVGVLTVAGEPVAAAAWLQMGNSLFLYYSGFEPRWSKYSVAMVLTAEVLKRAIAQGRPRIEFLRGTDPFKTRWGSTQRVLFDVATARRPGLVRPLLQAAVAGRQSYRQSRQAIRRMAVKGRDGKPRPAGTDYPG